MAVAERCEPVTHAWALGVAIKHQIVLRFLRSGGRPFAGAGSTHAVKMGGTAHHEQICVAQLFAACINNRDHDHVVHRLKPLSNTLANGIGDRVRVAEHRLVDDHRPHGHTSCARRP